MILQPGQILTERYKILRALGAGGMGAAHLAQDKNLERHCVIKEMRSLDEATQSQFEREAKLLASLRHPNLPEAYHYFMHRGHPFLVMTYVEGQTLDQLQAELDAPFEISDVLKWAYDLLAALQYMHQHDPAVVHRDIKPQNVCITPKNEAILLDFGIARPLDEAQTRTAAQAWSQGYAPIEQYRLDQLRHIPTGQQYLETLRAEGFHSGPYTDIYGLGATLYFALTELAPPDAVLRVLQDELRHPQKVNPLIPDRLAAAVTRALSIHPKQRFKSAAEMRRTLQPITSSVPVTPSPAVSAAPIEPGSPESTYAPELEQLGADKRMLLPRWLTLGIGAGLTLLAFLAVLLWLGTRQGDSNHPSPTPSATSTPTPETTPDALPSATTLTTTPSPSPTTTSTATSSPTATHTPLPSTPTSPYTFPLTILAEQLPIFAAPGEEYEQLSTVHRGDQLRVTGRLSEGDWWQVDFFGLQGWIRAQPYPPETAPSALPVVTPPALSPVTATPTLSPVPPTPTPLPTPACATAPGAEFAAAWQEPLISARLGCPTTPEHVTGSAHARFQNGFMYWREDERLIYVLYDDGGWQAFPDTWEEGQDPPDTGLTPPSPELQEPIRGFGKVWREQLGGPEAAIGWATENEIGGDSTIEDFKGGLMFELKGTTYLLYRDSMTWQPYSPGVGIPSTPISTSSLYLAFVRGFADEADIWIVDSDGNNPTPLVSGRGDQSEPDWFPDGQRLAYQSNQNGNYDVWGIDVADGSQRALAAGSVDEREPDWSPDGQQIVYRRGGERNGDGELWVMDTNGEMQRPLGQAVLGRAPVWSPDGQRVAFMSERGGNWDIYRFDLTSGETTRLTECETHCRFPAWTLDGTYVAYNVSESASNFSPVQIWQVPADGTGTPQLLIEGGNPGRPTWSKEGWVAFNTSDGIDVMRADGSDRHSLPNADEGWAPTWSR